MLQAKILGIWYLDFAFCIEKSTLLTAKSSQNDAKNSTISASGGRSPAGGLKTIVFWLNRRLQIGAEGAEKIWGFGANFVKGAPLPLGFYIPPLGWGGGPEIVGIWEKKGLDSWYLRSQKSVFGPAEGRKF